MVCLNLVGDQDLFDLYCFASDKALREQESLLKKAKEDSRKQAKAFGRLQTSTGYASTSFEFRYLLMARFFR